MTQKRGTLFVISAPSGAGKRTVLQEVFKRDSNLAFGVSATSRPPRRGEVDGRDYVFLERDEFRRRIDEGGFVEWAEVHGNLYGTLHEQLDRHLASGKDVILELDVQGMRSIKKLMPGAVSVFIMAPTFAELANRLRSRGTDAEEEIVLRLKNARAEAAARNEYDHIIVNKNVGDAAAAMEAIIRAQRRRATKTTEE